MKVSPTVWRKGWRRDAIATQEAAQAIAGFIDGCEQSGYHATALLMRELAMREGARYAARKMWRVFAARQKAAG